MLKKKSHFQKKIILESEPSDEGIDFIMMCVTNVTENLFSTKSIFYFALTQRQKKQ